MKHMGPAFRDVDTCPVMLSPRPSNHTDSIVVLLVAAIVSASPSAVSLEFITSVASTSTLAGVMARTTSSTPEGLNCDRSLTRTAGPSNEPTSPANRKLTTTMGL